MRVATKPAGTKVATARVRFRVTLTLDLTTTVPIAGKPYEEVVFGAGSENRNEFPFEVPPLTAGRHCLVVTMLEPSENRSGIDHSMATVIDLLAGDGPEHCVGTRVGTAEVADPQVAVSCHTPLISPDRHGALRRSRLDRAQEAWLHVPRCDGASTLGVLFFRNERPILGDGKFSSIAMPADGRIRTLSLGTLPSASWRAVLVAQGEESLAVPTLPVTVS